MNLSVNEMNIFIIGDTIILSVFYFFFKVCVKQI